MKPEINLNIEKLPFISFNHSYQNNNINEKQIKKQNKLIDEFLNRLDNKNNKNTNNNSLNNNSHNSSDFDVEELQINEGEVDPFDSTEIEKLKNLKKVTPENNKAELLSRNEQRFDNLNNLSKNKNFNIFPTFIEHHPRFKFKNKIISLNNLVLTQTNDNNNKDKFISMENYRIRNTINYNSKEIDNLNYIKEIKKNEDNKRNIKKSFSLNNIIDNKNSKKIMTSNFKVAQLYLMHSKILFRKRNITAKINKNNHFTYTSRNYNAKNRIMSMENIFDSLKNNRKNFPLCWKNKNKLCHDQILSKKELKLKLSEIKKININNKEKYNGSSKQKNNLRKEICRIKGNEFNSFFG